MSMEERYTGVMEQIAAAADRVCRSPSEVTLVAVSKTQSLELIQELHEVTKRLSYPLILGENYVQEFKAKRPFLSGVEAHLIGPLQRNKVRDALKLFDVIESVHSRELAHAIQKEAALQAREVGVYLQVNISEDEKKAGFSPEVLPSALEEVGSLQNIRLLGLMTITRYFEVPEEVRPYYRAMNALRERVVQDYAELFQDKRCRLSMGMSRDFEVAIEEGADLVRVGTALFGERDSTV